MAVETNADLVTPAGFLGHDDDAPGKMSPAAARALLALVAADLSDAGQLATADFVDLDRSGAGAPSTSAQFIGQCYRNTSNGDLYVAKSRGSGAADWEKRSPVSAAGGQKLVYDADNNTWVAETETRRFSFQVFGTVGTALDSKARQLKLPWPWKLVAVREKVSAGSITVTAKIGEGGTAITGVNALTLNHTSWTETTVSSGNTGSASQLFEYVFGTGSSLADLQVEFVFERNGYN